MHFSLHLITFIALQGNKNFLREMYYKKGYD